MDGFDFDDFSFLNSYGNASSDSDQYWNRSVLERLFLCGYYPEHNFESKLLGC